MEAPPLERKLVAIFAADVAGYSRLMEADEEATLVMLSRYREIIDRIIAEHRGRIAGTAGDSVLAEFPSVIDAVNAAREIQQALAEENRMVCESGRMDFRVGINVGDIMVKDGDIFGDGVNIAARLESLAEPGGICVSRGVRDHIRGKLEIGFEDLGEQTVKNIAQPIRVFRLRDAGAGDEPTDAGHEEPAPAPGDVEIEFWDSIKHSANALEYRAYLEQYPEGTFAAIAQARLAALDEGEPAVPVSGAAAPVDPKAIELSFWDTIKDTENPEMYRAYLDKYPAGEFSPLAQIKLTELEAGSRR
jgi:class 3 adenylate cyclase